MGRLVRRYIQVWHQSVRKDIEAGTEAVPITQFEAAQIPVQAFINVIALGGNVHGGLFGVTATVSLTGDINVVRASFTVNNAIVVTGDVCGIKSEVSALGTGGLLAGKAFQGMRIDLYAEAGALPRVVYGIFMTNYLLCAQPTNYYFIRLSENGSVTVQAAMFVRMGGTSDMTNLFNLFHWAGACTAWDTTANPPGAMHGRIAVLVEGIQHYIPLYH